jgi:hypothetical protein
MVNGLFPKWADVVEHWDVEDVELCSVETALKRLDERIRALRVRLCGTD